MQRLLDKIKVDGKGCWIFQGHKDKNGYGGFSARGEKRAHRASYRIYKGEIPDGVLVCHTCDVPSCVNPDHLFLGSPKDNTTDMMQKGRFKGNVGHFKTHCVHGHELTEETVYRTNRGRACATCNKQRALKRYYDMKKENQ